MACGYLELNLKTDKLKDRAHMYKLTHYEGKTRW